MECFVAALVLLVEGEHLVRVRKKGRKKVLGDERFQVEEVLGVLCLVEVSTRCGLNIPLQL